jgi:hypothetical protein
MLGWLSSLLGMARSYCVRCRANEKIGGVKEVEIDTPSGLRRIRRGNCKTCGSSTSQFIQAA